MAYFLDGASDSTATLLAALARHDVEFGEIPIVIHEASAGPERLSKILASGEIKTPLALAFLCVVALERGVAPAVCADALAKVNSELLEVDCARAFAHAKAGNSDPMGRQVVDAWRSLPDFAPLSRNYPEPSIVEDVKGDSNSVSKKIFLPLGLYVRMRVDELLLRQVLNRAYEPDFSADIAALKTLSAIKGLGGIEPDWQTLDSLAKALGQDNPRGELLACIGLARQSGAEPLSKLNGLRFPVSRAAYLDYLAEQNTSGDDLAPAIIAEIDSSRQRLIWENRILLSRGLLKVTDPQKAFQALSNLAVS